MSTPPPELEVLQDRDMPDPGPSPPSTPRRTPPPPPLGLFPAAGLLKDPMRDARERLLRAATYGSLRDAHETLCWYMSTQTPDPVTGEFELYHLQESIRAAIANNQPPLLSYLFFMRIGEPSFFVEDALRVRSPAVFQVFLRCGWDINKPRGRHLAPALG